MGDFIVIGGCDKDRTCDPYDVNVVLIPLSYTPETDMSFTSIVFIWQDFYY